MSWLDEWRMAVGHNAADEIMRDSSRIGTRIHKKIEAALLGTEFKDETEPKLYYVDVMAISIQSVIAKNFTEIWGVEAPVYFDDFYAGTSDLIGIWGNKPAIIDYKTGLRRKSQERLAAYAKQAAAYAIAHDSMFGTTINQCVIIEASVGSIVRPYVFDGVAFSRAKSEWMANVEKYYVDELERLQEH